MSYVAVNVLDVPAEGGPTLEARFAGRAGLVEQAPGFERFELLRPVEGTGRYLVYTRWRSREDFEAWTQSAQFSRGHGHGGQPAATGAELWAFEVVASAPRTGAG